ncbi:MAG: hypothetical protein CL722_05710 [Chloroflexi bacterium]|jgi:hypothetical protein|nr:hypothetical protein [Chloroflexota bacterium]|tara:strand:- start:3346 stop:4188 length:843 start_codon:yes stop_codon:yes gene_type:complete
MRRNRAEIQVFSISFLDVLSCALGAVLILLIVVPMSPPSPEAKLKVIQKLKAIITSITTENKSLEQQISALEEEQSKTIPQPTKKPVPSLFGLPLKADHAIFLVDVSPSMLWQIDNLYETVSSLLNSCEVKQYRFIYFDAIVYNSGRYWRHGWLKGTPENKNKSLRDTKLHLSELIPNEPGGTNSGDALYEAIKFRETDVIYFITDGHPTVGETRVESILRRVRRINNNNIIINSIMVGLPGTTINQWGGVIFDPAANPKELYDFLHSLAEENNGVYVGR